MESITVVLRNVQLVFTRNMPMFYLSSSSSVGFFPIKALFQAENKDRGSTVDGQTQNEQRLKDKQT